MARTHTTIAPRTSAGRAAEVVTTQLPLGVSLAPSGMLPLADQPVALMFAAYTAAGGDTDRIVPATDGFFIVNTPIPVPFLGRVIATV